MEYSDIKELESLCRNVDSLSDKIKLLERFIGYIKEPDRYRFTLSCRTSAYAYDVDWIRVSGEDLIDLLTVLDVKIKKHMHDREDMIKKIEEFYERK